ncbi:sterol-binding protein [Savitreella phatthalungensis]
MFINKLPLIACLATVALAAPRPAADDTPKAKRQVVEYVTAAPAVVTQYNTVGFKTVYNYITMTVDGAPAPSAVVAAAAIQTQVIVDVISAQYTYSSARTVFAVPTVYTQTVTQVAKVTPTDGNAPPATTTITNTINPASVPASTAGYQLATATLPAVLVNVGNAVVTVPVQTLTYYEPLQTGVVAVASSSTTSAVAQTTAVQTAPLTASSTQTATTSPNTTPVTAASTSTPVTLSSSTVPTIKPATQTTVTGIATTISSDQATLSQSAGQTSSSAAAAVTTVSTTTFSSCSSTTTAPAATSSIALSNDASFQNQILYAVNSVRSQHSSPFVTWNTQLAADALAYAQTCNFDHAPQPADDASKFGETLAAGSTSDPAWYTSLWAQEASLYDYNNPGFSKDTGHFTQMVWQTTSQVGCGFTSGCPGQYPYYLVCRWQAPGNVVSTSGDAASYFRSNVLPN